MSLHLMMVFLAHLDYFVSSSECDCNYMRASCSEHQLNVDVALEFPQKCFTPTDLLDGKYSTKRILYLYAVAGTPELNIMGLSVSYGADSNYHSFLT